MIDQVLARVGRLGHRAFDDILKSDVAVEIDHRRHDRLACEIDMDAGWYLDLAAAADGYEPIVCDDEYGILDGGAAVSRDEPRSVERGDSGNLVCLPIGLPGTGRYEEQRRGEEEATHGS